MTNTIRITLALFLVILTNILGHFFPPTSIMLSPLTIGSLTGLLLYTDFKVGYRVLCITFAIIFNDMCIRSYAGGVYDLEGAGFINMFLVIGLIISTVIITGKAVFLESTSVISKIGIILIMPSAMSLYILYFGFYGLSYRQPMSLTKESAVTNNTFLSELYFSKRDIVYDKDSLQIISGWTEKEIMINHNSLIRKTEESGSINYRIELRDNLKRNDFSVYYKVNSDDINGASPVDSVLRFSAKTDSISLTFFKLIRDSVTKDSLIGKVTVKSK